MREIQELTVEPRQNTGKGASYQIRQKGRLPAVVYGGGEDPESISVDAAEIHRYMLKGGFRTTVFHLNNSGKVTRAIPREVQLDPVSDKPIHIDFFRLPEGATIRLAIPVRFSGHAVSPGLKRGGTLNIVRHTVDLICPADNIPEYLEGDLSQLGLNASLHLGNMNLPEGVIPAIKGHDNTVASIVAPTSVLEEIKAAAEAAEAPAAEAAEGDAADAAAPAADAEKK